MPYDESSSALVPADDVDPALGDGETLSDLVSEQDKKAQKFAVEFLKKEGYSGVVLKTWSVKVVVTVRSSGRFPAQPRSAPAGRLAWWDGVSHVVTRPAREHVT